MTKTHYFKTIFVLGAILITLAVSGSGQTVPPAQSAAWSDPAVRAAEFGLQTLEVGRTLRINVLNAASPLGYEEVPSINSSELRYRVRVDFDIYSERAGDGSVRFLRRQTREMVLGSGDGLTLDYTNVAGDGSVRVASSVLVLRAGNRSFTGRAERVTATLEMIGSGGSIFSLPGVIRGFNPQPDPPRH